jgi:hypothetical protein
MYRLNPYQRRQKKKCRGMVCVVTSATFKPQGGPKQIAPRPALIYRQSFLTFGKVSRGV